MICGVGINDVPGAWELPLYRVWGSMLRRCYSPKEQAQKPTYKGCSVCKPWHKFSTFLRWAESRWTPGLHLDKDILTHGNKIYSPSACAFVTPTLKSLLNDCKASRGKWPIGVAPNRSGFQAQCRIDGELKRLGTFATPEEAHAVYVAFKSKLIRRVATEQTDPRLAASLRRHAKLLEASA